MPKKSLTLVMVLVFVLGLIFTGCDPDVTTPPETVAERGLTGEIDTGKTVSAASQTINNGGGKITITKDDSPINGLELSVPAGAYTAPVDFSISYAPIEKQTFGEDCNPLTPMITIDGALELSDEIVNVTVPVVVPDGQFAMGFIYDADTGKLMGMSTVAQDDTSITLATRHFCSFFISAVDKETLAKDIDSGFRPGTDDWQFNNYGSYIEPGGHCAGQVVTAIWYYVNQPDGKGAALYGRYDNNGQQPSTPDLQYDDSLGYRLASVVQDDIDWSSWENKFWWGMAGLNDSLTFNLLAYSMRLTHEPQEVGVFSNAGGGHALVCYRVSNSTLFIADPNYEGNLNRRIFFSSDNRSFDPYNSGANKEDIDAGKGKNYETIEFCPKDAMIPWKSIASRWAEMKAGTIGDTRFPAFQLQYTDDKGKKVNLVDGYVSAVPEITITAPSLDGKTDTGCIYFRDGERLKADQKGTIGLVPGNNLIGVYVLGQITGKDAKGNTTYAWRYIDFVYVNIVYDVLSIEPSGVQAETGEEVFFRAKGGGVKEGNWFTWKVDGDVIQEDTMEMLVTAFDTPGKHTVELEMLDYETGDSSTTAATADITAAKTTAPATPPLTGSRLEISCRFLANWFTSYEDGVQGESVDLGTADVTIENLSWSGKTFHGVSEEYTIDGQINSDNSIDFDLSFNVAAAGYTGYDILHITGLPMTSVGVGPVEWIAKGLDMKKYLACSVDVDMGGGDTYRLLGLVWPNDRLNEIGIVVKLTQ